MASNSSKNITLGLHRIAVLKIIDNAFSDSPTLHIVIYKHKMIIIIIKLGYFLDL